MSHIKFLNINVEFAKSSRACGGPLRVVYVSHQQSHHASLHVATGEALLTGFGVPVHLISLCSWRELNDYVENGRRFGNPHLVIVDMGFAAVREAIAAFKDHRALGSVPVVINCWWDAEWNNGQHILEAIEFKADGMYEQPYAFDELVDVVKEIAMQVVPAIMRESDMMTLCWGAPAADEAKRA